MAQGATVLSASINLVKTILGAGLFAIPYAFRSDGIFVGMCLIALAAITSAFGLFILARSSKTMLHPRNASFFTMCMLTYPKWSPVFDACMILQCFGVGLSYLVLIGDVFPGIFGGQRNYWIAASALVTIPLSCLKKIDHLKYSSMLGLFALAYLSLFVVARFVNDVLLSHKYQVERGQVSYFWVYDWNGLLTTFSIIIFAYVGAMNLFSIIGELDDNSLTNISTVINRSIGVSTIAFLLVGITGYLTFGSNTSGNIILNYDPNSLWISVGKFCLGSMLVLSFPLLFHPLRNAVNNVYLWLKLCFAQDEQRTSLDITSMNRENNAPITLAIVDDDTDLSLFTTDNLANENETGMAPTIIHEYHHEGDVRVGQSVNEQKFDFPSKRFYSISLILLVSMYGLAMKLTSFASVLSIVGATGSTSISFILPGLFGYKLIGTDYLAMGRVIPPKDRFYKRCSLLLAVFGIMVMVFSLYTTLHYSNAN